MSIPATITNMRVFFFPKSLRKKFPHLPESVTFKELSFEEETKSMEEASTLAGKDANQMVFSLFASNTMTQRSMVKWGDKNVEAGMVDYRLRDDVVSAKDIMEKSSTEVRTLLKQAYMSMNSRVCSDEEVSDFLEKSQVVA